MDDREKFINNPRIHPVTGRYIMLGCETYMTLLNHYDLQSYYVTAEGKLAIRSSISDLHILTFDQFMKWIKSLKKYQFKNEYYGLHEENPTNLKRFYEDKYLFHINSIRLNHPYNIRTTNIKNIRVVNDIDKERGGPPYFQTEFNSSSDIGAWNHHIYPVSSVEIWKSKRNWVIKAITVQNYLEFNFKNGHVIYRGSENNFLIPDSTIQHAVFSDRSKGISWRQSYVEYYIIAFNVMPTKKFYQYINKRYDEIKDGLPR